MSLSLSTRQKGFCLGDAIKIIWLVSDKMGIEHKSIDFTFLFYPLYQTAALNRQFLPRKKRGMACCEFLKKCILLADL